MIHTALIATARVEQSASLRRQDALSLLSEVGLSDLPIPDNKSTPSSESASPFPLNIDGLYKSKIPFTIRPAVITNLPSHIPTMVTTLRLKSIFMTQQFINWSISFTGKSSLNFRPPSNWDSGPLPLVTLHATIVLSLNSSQFHSIYNCPDTIWTHQLFPTPPQQVTATFYSFFIRSGPLQVNYDHGCQRKFTTILTKNWLCINFL